MELCAFNAESRNRRVNFGGIDIISESVLNYHSS